MHCNSTHSFTSNASLNKSLLHPSFDLPTSFDLKFFSSFINDENYIQSSEIVGRDCNQSPRFNAFKNYSEERPLSQKVNAKNLVPTSPTPHQLESSFTSCASTMKMIDLEFNSSSYFKMETCEDINLKSFLLQHAHSSSILREVLHRLKEIEPRILPSSYSSTKETSNKISSLNVEKILANVDPKLVTPSPHLKRKKSSLTIVTSTMIASSLASNAKSESVFRLKRRPSKAPLFKNIFSPLKKSSSPSIRSSSLEPPSNLLPNFESSFSFHLNSSEFPKSLTSTSKETRDDPTLEKKVKSWEKVNEEREVKTIFKKGKGSRTFKGIFNSLEFFSSSTLLTLKNHFKASSSYFNLPSKTSIKEELKVKIKKRDFLPLHSSRFSSTRKAFDFYFNVDSNNSSSCLPPTCNEENSSNHPEKEILGSTKTLDLPKHAIIIGKSSGTNETFSFSHLGTSIVRKSKVSSENHLKSSFKTKSDKSNLTYFSSSTSNGKRNLTLPEIVNG